MADAGDAHVDVLRARAQRKWITMMAVGGGLSVISGVVCVVLLSPDTRPGDGYDLTTMVLGVLVFAAVVAVGMGGLVWTAHATGDQAGRYSAPLAMALPYRQRRAAMRAVRHGEPSHDATLARVEHNIAERSVRQSRTSLVLAPIFVLTQVILAVTDAAAPTALRAAQCVLGVAILASVPRQLRTLHGARRYLVRAAE